MTKITIITLAGLMAIVAGNASADVLVRSYTKQDGTFVQGHVRSSPDGNPYNNYGN